MTKVIHYFHNIHLFPFEVLEKELIPGFNTTGILPQTPLIPNSTFPITQ